MGTKSPVPTFTVFFSWQDDSPRETNTDSIRRALNALAKQKGTFAGAKMVPDEATRGTSGSPNIVSKIQEKIDAADAFIADITTISGSGTKSACPNPNVVFELGYAVAQLGWD